MAAIALLFLPREVFDLKPTSQSPIFSVLVLVCGTRNRCCSCRRSSSTITSTGTSTNGSRRWSLASTAKL